jgi:hypothetical protein
MVELQPLYFQHLGSLKKLQECTQVFIEDTMLKLSLEIFARRFVLGQALLY